MIAGKLAARIARKDSLALKLAMRPDRQELIDRGILHAQTERERHMQREAVGARLTRFTSLSLSLYRARTSLLSFISWLFRPANFNDGRLKCI